MTIIYLNNWVAHHLKDINKGNKEYSICLFGGGGEEITKATHF
jgi:hypothetical protein